MSLLFTGVLIYQPDHTLSSSTDVLVEGQRIVHIGGDARHHAGPHAQVVRGDGHHLLIPGLINAHFHSPANHLKGLLPSLPLELFMLYESPADEALRPSPREAYLRTMLGAMEMLRGGTTSVQDDAFLMPAPEPDIIDAMMAAYRDCGIRATVALDQPELSDRDKLPFIDDVVVELGDSRFAQLTSQPAPMPREDLLDRYRYLFQTWHDTAGGRLRAAVSVSAPQRVSVEYYAALDALSARYNAPLYSHMLETKTQRALAAHHPRFEGRSLVRWTADHGLLNERTNVIHAVWVDNEDLDLIAHHGATVAHNPVSNLRLGSGIMPFRAMRDRGIPIALGVDEAICNDATDMWSVLRATGLVHNIGGEPSATWPSVSEVLDCAWAGGARAQRRSGELGAVATGYLADLALIDLHSPAFTPLNDVAGQLVYCENGASVVMTVVDGVIVAEGGRVTSVDEKQLLAEAREMFAARRGAYDVAAHAASRYRPGYAAIVERARRTDVGMTRWVGK